MRTITPEEVSEWTVSEIVDAMDKGWLLDIVGAAEYLGFARETIYNALKKGRLNRFRIGRHSYFAREWLDEYKATRKIGRPRKERRKVGRPRKAESDQG